MSHNPWIAIGHAVIKGIAQHRAKSRLADSIGGEERELLRAGAMMKGGVLGGHEGFLAITSRGVRFETATVAFDKQPVFISLSDIQRVSTEPGMLWGGTLHLKTSDGTTSFEFGSRGLMDKVATLVRENT